jgi:Cytochrome c554 and c-prime
MRWNCLFLLYWRAPLLVAVAAGCEGGFPHESSRGPAAGGEPQRLGVLVSGDTAGWIVPCGCTSNQSGGLLRRGTFVQQQREQRAIVVLDAGGAPAGTSPYERAKFEAILDGERGLGVAAHNLGGPEIALGADYLRQLAAQKQVPFISANTTDAVGRPLVDTHRIVEAGGQRLAVVGIVSQRYATPIVRIGEPRAGVLAVQGELRGRIDGLIVLAYLPEEELRAFAAGLPEADAVVGGPTGQSIAPTRVGPVLLASASNKGKFLVSLVAPADRRHGHWEGSALEMTAQFADDAIQRQNLAQFRAALELHDFTAEESGLAGAPLTGLPADYRVAGTEACRDCHAADCKKWDASSHARAWTTLTSQGAQFDSYCQQCHTTGFGWPGGFVSAKRSLQRVNVGCESCHGPSLAHAQQPTSRTPQVAREACTRCHDHENSPEFEFAKYWEAIAHPDLPARAVSISPAGQAPVPSAR